MFISGRTFLKGSRVLREEDMDKIGCTVTPMLSTTLFHAPYTSYHTHHTMHAVPYAPCHTHATVTMDNMLVWKALVMRAMESGIPPFVPSPIGQNVESTAVDVWMLRVKGRRGVDG